VIRFQGQGDGLCRCNTWLGANGCFKPAQRYCEPVTAGPCQGSPVTFERRADHPLKCSTSSQSSQTYFGQIKSQAARLRPPDIAYHNPVYAQCRPRPLLSTWARRTNEMLNMFLRWGFRIMCQPDAAPAVLKRLFTPSLLGAKSVTPSAGFGRMPSSCGINAMAAQTA